MPHLFGWVEYADQIHGWEPTGADLVAFTQDNPMLELQRRVLSEEFPRRRFETELEVTVGGFRADKGTYYRGRERVDGLARLGALQHERKLGLVSGQHLISKTFDRDDHTRNESTWVSVEARFTRPVGGSGASARASLQTRGVFGDRHLDALVAALWATFHHLVDVAPVVRAFAYWDRQAEEYLRPAVDDPPVAAFMLIDGSQVSALGGAQSAADRLGAFAWKAVRNDAMHGVLLQLGRRPEDTIGDRLAHIRSQLRTPQPP